MIKRKGRVKKIIMNLQRMKKRNAISRSTKIKGEMKNQMRKKRKK